MNVLSSFFSGITAYLPQVIIGMVVIAIIIMILVVVLTSTSFKHALKKKTPPAKVAETPKPTRPAEDKMPPHWGIISEMLSMRGYFRVGDISLSFLRALDLLRQRLDTVNFKYFMPWYLMIGPEKSGKTTLMNRSELVFPLGQPNFGLEDPHPGIKWCFLNHGIVLDVNGNFFISQQGVKADEKGWRTVLSLLNRYRARRPIDGILLTIPVSDLYGANKLTAEEIKDRAQFMAQKLSATQNILSLRLPVYVILTKGDVLPGFQSICQSIPAQNRHNILGWSSPYHPGTAFTSSWIDEAFGHLHHQLNQLRMEILTEGASPETRDGVFIFPFELSHLIAPLTTYLAQIFKVNSYDESLVLRGIYLAGDSGINIDFSQLNTTPHQPEFSQEGAEQVHREAEEEAPIIRLSIGELEADPLQSTESLERIYFFNDVLNEKVFKETGLAQPIHHRLLSMNRNLNYAKVGMIGFIGLSMFGLMHAYERMSLSRDYLLPVLGKINTTLYKIPESRLDESMATSHLFDQQARQLLDMMNNIEKASFFSTFMPSSWFSPVQDNLRVALKVSFDQIILRTIYVDLLMKSRDLLTLRPTPKDVTESLAVQLQPTATVEFQLLKGFVERFIDLADNIDKYNLLQESSDPSLIKDLAAYTLGVELPKEFVENYSRFRRILKEIPYPKIDLKPYQGAARETLSILYNHFLQDLMATNDQNSIIGKINYILNEFGHNSLESLPKLDYLRKISQDLNTSISTLGKPGSNWIDGQYFDPGTAFSDVMTQISQFPMFGPEMVDAFATNTAVSFGNFQQFLRQLNTILLDPSAAVVTADKPVYPSDGLTALEKSLVVLFDQQFMAPPSGEKFITDIPPDQVVFWNPKMVDAASDEIKKYQEFVDKKLPEFPPVVRETLKQIARKNLQDNISSLLAKAQTLAPIPQNLSETVAAEETLRNKIADVKEISPKFTQLLEVMSHGGIGSNFVELRTMLGTLSTRLLGLVDQLLTGYKLYRVKDDNFDWWDGLNSPILEGFNVTDPQDLKSSLEQQRQILRNLALDYAEPMITFLSAPIMKEFEGNTILLNKWRRIMDEVKAYESKRPDNTITLLETAITTDLVGLDLKKCFKAIPLQQVKHASGDFFTNRQIALKRGILARCEVLQRHKAISSYQKLSAFFNDNLKQKFPFILKAANNTPEAEPEDLKDFFKIYKEAGDAPKAILDQVYQLGSDASDAYSFLEAMEKVKIFFDPYLTSKNPADLPAFDFTVNFRTNQAREVKGNLIIDWIAMPDDQIKITNHDKSRNGKWIFGDSFVLTLRWPTASQVQPYMDPAQAPVMTVDNGTATFAYPGRWSLLWMLRKQLAPSADYSPITDPFPYVLKFNIPNGPVDKTTVYSTVTLLTPPKGTKSGKPMRLPDFPERAPELTENVLSKADEAVLVNGTVEDIEPVEQVEEPVPEVTEAPAPKEEPKKDEKPAEKSGE